MDNKQLAADFIAILITTNDTNWDFEELAQEFHLAPKTLAEIFRAVSKSLRG
jgi:AraC-like DNA-binding protein